MDDKEREARDHRFEEFVLEQVYRYGDMHAKAGKVYTGCVIACIVMCVAGLILGKSVPGALYIGLWSIGFLAASRASAASAEAVKEAGGRIRAAIDDPEFDIPDDYPEDILSLRALVCPTLRNIRSQVIAYGIIAASCWAGSAIIIMASSTDGFNAVIFVSGLVMGAMAFCLTILAIRAWRDIPIARAYENYLNEAAADVDR